MNQFSDQILARRMLESRDHGSSYLFFFCRSVKRYLLPGSYMFVVLVGSTLLQYWMFFFFMLGMFAGCLFRDLGWTRTQGDCAILGNLA